MGVQSFKFPIDFLNNLENPIIYIAKKDKTIINSVPVYDGLKLTCNLNAFQTAEFKIYRDIDGKTQDYFEDFEEGMLILIPGISWYEIHVETNIEPTGITKSITANSLECKLCSKRLVNFQINCNDLDTEDYAIIPFYNPTDLKHSLLHKILNVSSIWTVGHVDKSLENEQRTFDVDDTDVYSFLTEEVSEAFNCLFVFDTFNCTVNAYDLDNYGNDTNIFISMDNLAQNMTETIDANSIFTCYRVNGGNDIQIAEVNPNGTNKIYNFEYYLPQMSQEIQAKVIAYNNKFQSLQPQYEDIMVKIQTQLEKIHDLYNRIPDSLTSTNWTEYGLELLQSREKSFATQDELYCAYGYNAPSDIHYDLYKQNHQKLNEVKSEISIRQAEIDNAKNEYNNIYDELTNIHNQLNMDNWFTVDEWKSLDNYVIEETYTNDNYGAVDNTNESELLNIEKELYDTAWKDLSKKCRPQYQYSATLSNILTIPEFKNFVKYFELGNFIRMETDYDTVIKLRIISFTIDYTNTQTIDVTFSDAIRVKDVYEDAASIQAQANSAAMSFKFNKDQYDSTVKQGNFVAEMRKYGLDVATTAIHNSSNQSQVWDDTGMTFRQWNDQRQDYDPEQIKIINNQIVFTDSNFDDTKMAIGKVALSNGNFAYGINAEVFVGTAIFSQYFTAQNPSGTFKIDDAGFIASNGTNTIKIQPNNSGELFSIYKGNEKQVYIDSNGNARFKGDISGSTGTFSGLLKGGSIDIGNGTFTVDSTGSMYASKGTIGGWSINKSYIYSDNGKTSDGRTLKSIIQPGQILFADINSQNDCMVINYDVIGWEKYLTFIKKDHIQSSNVYTSDLYFNMSSSPTINSSNTITFNSDINFSSKYRVNFNGEDGKNVHFYNTPYIDKHSCYLARHDWCNSNFAKIKHSHDEITNLSNKVSTLSDDITDLTRTFNNHTHPKYTTEKEVRSIVRSMMKD